MRTIKLVVVGTSGVGKTSLRNQVRCSSFASDVPAQLNSDFDAFEYILIDTTAGGLG